MNALFPGRLAEPGAGFGTEELVTSLQTNGGAYDLCDLKKRPIDRERGRAAARPYAIRPARGSPVRGSSDP